MGHRTTEPVMRCFLSSCPKKAMGHSHHQAFSNGTFEIWMGHSRHVAPHPISGITKMYVVHYIVNLNLSVPNEPSKFHTPCPTLVKLGPSSTQCTVHIAARRFTLQPHGAQGTCVPLWWCKMYIPKIGDRLQMLNFQAVRFSLSHHKSLEKLTFHSAMIFRKNYVETFNVTWPAHWRIATFWTCKISPSPKII